MTCQLIHADCRDALRLMTEASVDAIVTDPPYELGFMGKRWDATGIAYSINLWRECLRVLKPGGHLLAFGGTRTYHRMACAIEDAGFDIRDSIHWLYGSGFPKSLDVSKAIDKAAGAEREVVGEGPFSARRPRAGEGVTIHMPPGNPITAPATAAANQWEGWGTALKPAHEPIVVARKPLAGTVAANVLAHGTGALNIDGCRVGFASEADERESKDKNRHADFGTEPGRNNVYGDYLMVGVKNYPPGRWPANIVFTHAADCGDQCAEGCPVAALDEQSGVSKSPAKVTRGGEMFGGGGRTRPMESVPCYGDTGGASRFFTTIGWDDASFRYFAKPSKAERNAGLDTPSTHPTVKPVALMRWLVRLVTPPDGTVLDPFAGSGTTLVAAVLEGFNAIGIEMTDDYLPIINGRIAWAEQQPRDLFGGAA